MGLLKQFGMASPEFLAWKENVDSFVNPMQTGFPAWKNSVDNKLLEQSDRNMCVIQTIVTSNSTKTITGTDLPDMIQNLNGNFVAYRLNGEQLPTETGYNTETGKSYLKITNSTGNAVLCQLLIVNKGNVTTID